MNTQKSLRLARYLMPWVMNIHQHSIRYAAFSLMWQFIALLWKLFSSLNVKLDKLIHVCWVYFFPSLSPVLLSSMNLILITKLINSFLFILLFQLREFESYSKPTWTRLFLNSFSRYCFNSEYNWSKLIGLSLEYFFWIFLIFYTFPEFPLLLLQTS